MMIKDMIAGLVLKDDLTEDLQVAAIMENPTLSALGGYLETKGFIDFEKLKRFEATGYKFEAPTPHSETMAPVLVESPSAVSASENGAVSFADVLKKKLTHFAAEVIGVPEDKIRAGTNFFEVGLDEVGTQMLVDLIVGNLQSQSFTKPLYPSVVMEHSSVESLARFLIEKGVVREEEHKV